MLIFPAIDLYEGKAVRLLRGDYDQRTVYRDDPAAVGREFAAAGAEAIHLVDLEGARDGTTPNFETVCRIREESGLFCEIGGGIRTLETVSRYLSAGLDRVILGTAAVTDEGFLKEAAQAYGEKIAVGVDLKDGFVAIRGWTETVPLTAEAFCERMANVGITTLIVTDVSKDGAMGGTNLDLYRGLQSRFGLRFTASGGVSSMADVLRLKELGLYGAIIGKAWYTGAIDLREAVEAAK